MLERLIAETFPHIKINKFRLLGQGKAATICLANDEIVFKVPLAAGGEIGQWQKNEAEVLKFLEGKLDIEIPKVLCTATSECGLFIIGETFLSGTSFSYELCDTYDEETKRDIQRQLGRIVRNLHNTGGKDASWQSDNNATSHETYDTILCEFYERLTPEVRGVFSPSEVASIENIATRYEQLSKQHPATPVLCHHDLHYCNLMFNEKARQITGLLDFGCAGYSEPARDWHYYFNAKFVLEGYGDTDDQFFLDRHRFHALSWLLNNLGEEIADGRELWSRVWIRDHAINN